MHKIEKKKNIVETKTKNHTYAFYANMYLLVF